MRESGNWGECVRVERDRDAGEGCVWWRVGVCGCEEECERRMRETSEREGVAWRAELCRRGERRLSVRGGVGRERGVECA